ncbi:transcriptional regulator [Streptomyces pluripotens]|uniref:Transcriptional regulator n=1 Tax=Streptomyces pluripotens TaxID=1355015 RepID=A0A221NX81_9ACTN|nr:helix-turn-helix domain-containing protein [Streptomyces pluripotens]ARP70326.1 transcriptional regulator [Streptomyces pluripotens]ASN24581.1 transcriptional regulator [Streptomyces pluripotens]
MRETIGELVRRLRLARGWSQRRLAEALAEAAPGRVPPTRNDVSRWEIGTRSPREWLPFLARVLQVPREMLEMAKAVQPVEPAPRVRSVADFLPEGDPLAPLRTRTGRRIGAGQVADLAQRVHGLRLADDVVYGKDLIGPALRELRAAVKLYREGTHTEGVGRELLRAIGELAQIAGWVASDAGEHAEAERIYRLGMSAAQAAGDGVLSGNVAGSLAYQWSNTGRTADAVGLAQAALKDAGPHAPAKARALYLDRVAWAHTRAGQDRPAMTALGEAAEALSEDSAGTVSPSYLYWMDAGELQVMEARVYTELHRPLRAVPLLTDVLGRYDASHARELALYLSWLAVAYADANEPEAAAGTAARMLALGQSGSERTAERTRIVLDRLRAYRNVPEVAELLAS